MPPLTKTANTSPKAAASAVRTAAMTRAWRCFCTVLAASVLTSSQHVSSDRVELLIEVVSQRVNTFQAIGRRLSVTAIERGKQALDLGVELTASISHRRIDTAIESSERGFVAQRLPFLDEAIDQCASGPSFTLDLHAFGVDHVADGRRLVAARC